MAPAAPHKRSCLAVLDENSQSNSNGSNEGRVDKTKNSSYCPLPNKKRLVDTSMSATFILKNLGVKPLPESPQKSRSCGKKSTFGFQGKRYSSFSSFSKAPSPDIFDFENQGDESGFFDCTPESENDENVSLRSLSQQRSSNRSLQRKSASFMSTPHLEVFPPSFYLLGRRRLVANAQKIGDNFSDLPDEMSLLILKWLPKKALGRLSQVSKKFNRLIRDESLWRRIDLAGKFLTSENINVVMSRNPTYLRFARSKVGDPIGLASDLFAPQLTHLDLSLAVIAQKTLAQLLGMCSSLVKLSLEYVEVGSEALIAMGGFTRSIETLNMTMCYNLPSAQLVAFLSNCSSLKILNLGWAKTKWSKDELLSVINSLPPSLIQLNMSGFRHLMNDTHVQILVGRCTNLIELDLSDCAELTMMALEAVSTLEKIEHLGLSRCYGIEMAGLSILISISTLRFLEIYAMLKESSIKALEAQLPGVLINNFPFSPIARPTFGLKRSSIWLERVRD